MSGEKNSTTDRQKIEETLNEFRQKIGVKECFFDEDTIDHIFNMTRQDLSLTTERERGIYSMCLAKFAFNIKLQENRCNALLTWVENRLRELVSREIAKYCDPQYKKMEEQLAIVSVHNDLASKMYAFNREFEVRLADIKDLHRSVDFMSRTLKDIKDENR